MTAVVTPIRSERHLRLVGAPVVEPALRPAPRRPDLVVVEGGRSAVARRRQAVYRRRRLATAAAALIVAMVLVRLVPAVFDAMTTAPPPQAAPALTLSGHTYVAQGGDTLWSVARALHVDGDVRDVVDRLAEVNGSHTLVAGQAIRIPADLLAS